MKRFQNHIKKCIYAVLFISSIGWVSCSDDFLETTSPSEFTSDVIYSTVAYTQYAVSGVYNVLMRDDLYSARLALNWVTNSDIEFVGADASSYNQNSNRGVSNYFPSADNSHIERTWQYLYQLIERANLCINGIENSPLMSGEPETVARMKGYLGEVLTLRALAYSELIKNFGDVPFKTEPTQSDLSNVYLPVTDRDTIYEHIIGDLQLAADYLPWVLQGDYSSVERVTKGFAKGLLARVALYRGGYSLRNKPGFPTERGSDWEKYYTIARDACKDVIEKGPHKLNPSYQNIWFTLNQLQLDANYQETLFEVAHGLGQTGEMGYSAGVRFYKNSKYGYGNNANVVNTSAYYFYMFDRKDLRRDATIAYYVYGNSDQEAKEVFQQNIMSYNIAKWDQRMMSDAWKAINIDANNKIGQGINWAIMRYSDVLLMYAETENELNGGPTTEAKEALKMVRERAFDVADQQEMVADYVNNLGGKEDFFNAIVRERALEFGGEGLRKYDLIRWNLLIDKIQEQRDGIAKMLNGEAPYGNLPTSLFIRYKDDNENLDKENINFYEDKGDEDIDGYERIDWLSGMSEKNKTDYIERVTLFSSGLTNNSAGVYNRHLYPVATSVISESQGKIQNTYGY